MDLVVAAGFVSSLLADFSVRTVPKSEILFSTIERLPLCAGLAANLIALRVLRLQCASHAFGDLWEDCYTDAFLNDSWTTVHQPLAPLGAVSSSWSPETPLRNALARRQAAIEVDALVALSLNISADELVAVYLTQFPVLAGYDQRNYIYDLSGRAVPNSVLAEWRTAGSDTSAERLLAEHPGSRRVYGYELPFTVRDRSTDLRAAYAVFEERLASRSEKSA